MENGKKKQTILVMFSGGVDSTFMLYHYLKNTDLNVHVHHISLRYPSEPRWKEEDIASRRIVEYCRKIRPFDYSESCFELGFYKYVGRDSDTQLLMASKVAPNLEGEVHVAIGWHNKDHTSIIERERRIRVTQNVWHALHDAYDPLFSNSVSRELLFPILEMGISKKEMIKMLPRELLQMTWSCRRPIKGDKGISRPCGKCHPCKDIKEALTV